jgi:hypothetical protein
MSDGAFVDVPKGHWAYDAVLELRNMGILVGYPPGVGGTSAAPLDKPQRTRYDVSSPNAAWRSLIYAMKKRDEAGLEVVLSHECYAADGEYDYKFGAFSADAKTRSLHYRELSDLWSKRVLVRVRPSATDSDRIYRANLVDLQAGPDPTDHWIWVRMERHGKSWRITEIAVN